MKDLRQILDENGYDYVDSYVVGQDPGTKAIRGYVIGLSRNRREYAVWSFWDWSMGKPMDKRRGIDVQWGHYGITSRQEAQQCMTY